jgi:PH domain
VDADNIYQYWRRRLFKLVGSKLTAYHETTHQPRATINLAKASKLIDDKSALTKKETSTKGGGRRKSAFAEEEEGYMFVEEGFRIRFANGEVIDFYADSAAEKGEWMKVLSEVVGKPGSSCQSKPWVDMILKRERSIAAKGGRTPRPVRPEMRPPKTSHEQMQAQMQAQMAPRAAATQRASAAEEEARRTAAQKPIGKRSSIPLLSGNQSPEKVPRYSPGPRTGHARTESYQPSSGSRSQPGSPVKGKLSREARHQKAKSMMGMQWH